VKRSLSNKIRYLMDDWLPPVIRDARWFMVPLLRIWFKNDVGNVVAFKERAYQISEDEFYKIYNENKSLGNDRPTDLSEKSIEWIEKKCIKGAHSLLDVGVGRGFFAGKMVGKFTRVAGCDILDAIKINGVEYRKASIENLPYHDKEFEVVTCFHTLEHTRHLELAIREIQRVCSKQLLIVVPRQRAYQYTFDHHLHFFPFSYSLARYFLNGKVNVCCLDGDWHLEWTPDNSQATV